jgi:hypothetical protein
MQLEDIVSHLECLIGKELSSLTTTTGSIVITKVDRGSKKYWIKAAGSNKSTPRTLRELDDILFELTRQGFGSVDQGLYDEGTTRDQPETIFAHLPNVQYFRFKKKIYLLLRDHPVHDLGVISTPQGAELRELRRRIENHLFLSNAQVAVTHSSLSKSLQQALNAIFKKLPGDDDVTAAENCLTKLDDLGQQISAAIVSLDDLPRVEKEELGSPDETRTTNLLLEELLDDESVTGIENQIEETQSEAITKPRIRQLTPTFSLIYDRLTYNEIELQPDFQRKDRIWKPDKKSKLIESILMGLPLPMFYFGEKENGDWVVIDGLQRITSVFDFMSGTFELEQLEILKHYNTKSYETLDRTAQRQIQEYIITAYLIDIKSDKENIIAELFQRINTYGIRLSGQEIRSGLNQGSSVTFLRYIAGLNEFKVATDFKIKPDRQRDMEICLSAVAFIVLGYSDFDYSKFDTFLSQTMKRLNHYRLELSADGSIDEGTTSLTNNSEGVYLVLAEKIAKALVLAHEIFGGFAFKKEPKEDRQMPLSKPLFELIVSAFYFLDDQQQIMLEKKSGDFLNLFYQAIANDSTEYATWIYKRYEEEGRGFQYAISTSTGKRTTIVYRFEAFKQILKVSTEIELDFKPLLLGSI